AREEQQHRLPEPPTTSGPHTVDSLGAEIRPMVTKIIDGHIARLVAEGAEMDATGALPADGLRPEMLTHDLYRHFGAMVRFDDVAKDKKAIVARAVTEVAAALIQQRERLHDLAYNLVAKSVDETCPANVHPDEWEVDVLEKRVEERFHAKLSIRNVPESQDALVDLCWDAVEALLAQREKELGLTVYLYHIRHIWLNEIDTQWIAHLKNIEHLRTGIGLVSYATRNPKNEYKIRGYNLFREMWEGIEQTVLDKVIRMQLTEEQRRRAQEGAEYETALTRANERRAAGRAGAARQSASQAQLDKLQAAARQAMQTLQSAPSAAEEVERAVEQARKAKKQVPQVRPNDPCPCGSGKRYKKCHGNEVTV